MGMMPDDLQSGHYAERGVAAPLPWADRRGTIKFIELAVPAPHLSRQQFHLYWQRHHSPHVMNCTAFSRFMRKYVTTHALAGAVDVVPAHYVVASPFEGVAEVWLDSLDEAIKWLSHPIYSELIQPDEMRFIDQTGKVEIFIAREEYILRPAAGMPETGRVKVHAIYRRRDGLAPAQFHAQLSQAAHAATRDPVFASRLRQLVISHRLPDPQPDGLPIAPIDAVAELWFDSLADARDFFTSPEYVDTLGRAEMSLSAGGVARSVVAMAHVVHDEYSFQPTVTQPHSFPWTG